MNRCPVCDGPMQRSYEVLDGFVMLQTLECVRQGCFLRVENSGTTRTRIGECEWSWYYRDADIEKKERAVSDAIAAARG